MDCLAAACQWLCQTSSSSAPARSESEPAKAELADDEWGDFQMAPISNEQDAGVTVQKSDEQVPKSPASVGSEELHQTCWNTAAGQEPCVPNEDMALKEQHIGVRVRRGLDMPPRWINMQLDHARRPDEQVPKSPASVGSEVEEEEPLLDHEACGVDIVLNIYDVSNFEPVRWFNTLFAYEHAPVKLGGFFHVGVQVGDEEWAFGATLSGSGVCRHKPRGAEMHHFRESIPMGSTTLSKRDLDILYSTLEATCSGRDYSLLQNNCIDFATKVCRLLKVADVPAWVNRPARISSSALQVFMPEPQITSDYL